MWQCQASPYRNFPSYGCLLFFALLSVVYWWVFQQQLMNPRRWPCGRTVMRGQIPELEKVPQAGRAWMQHPFFQVFAVMLEILPAVCPGTVRVIIFKQYYLNPNGRLSFVCLRIFRFQIKETTDSQRRRHSAHCIWTSALLFSSESNTLHVRLLVCSFYQPIWWMT